jgi:hypothetical protein
MNSSTPISTPAPVDLIPEQWDQLVRVAALLKNRVCPAHVVVQRLANSSPSNRLPKALTMLGRVVKTIYNLKYFNEEDLRHRVQLQLNRGEHRHSLARWIFFADQGEFRTGDYQEIMNKPSCLSLVSNAILVWNTLQIARIVDTLQQTGTPVAVEDLAHVSPLLHRHVIPNGTYHFPPGYRGGQLVLEYATGMFSQLGGLWAIAKKAVVAPLPCSLRCHGPFNRPRWREVSPLRQSKPATFWNRKQLHGTSILEA